MAWMLMDILNYLVMVWRLNRVVEKNVNQNMFVTMFYGLYEEMNHLLYCSSAGHELAIYIAQKLKRLRKLVCEEEF